VAGRHDDAVTGAHRFAADLVPEALHLVFVRSAVPHARITAVHTAAAASVPGVVAVLTAADLPMVPVWEIQLIPEAFAQPPLADGVVRYVGERVAAVVAVDLASALDGAEAVVVDHEELPAVVDARDALRAGAPVLFPAVGSNVALAWSSEVAGAPARADTDATVVVRTRTAVPRISACPMEGHSIVAVPGPDGRLTVHVSTQVPHGARVQIARGMGIDLDAVRVVVPCVGGGFGGKAAGGVVDHVVVAAAARHLGRPVRFVEDRGANLVSMQGRGVELDAEARARIDGTVAALRIDDLCDAGAYPITGSVEPGKSQLMATGPYRIPTVAFTARSVTTNLAPTGAYRGPGRSEAALVLERVMDRLAHELDLDPVAVRRANLLRRDELPRTTTTGAHLDEGDYHAVLDQLLETSGYAELRAEQRRRREAGDRRVLGLGVATVVDSSAWFDRSESAEVRVEPDGTITVLVATMSAGQQQAVAYASIVADVLAVDPSIVTVVEGDTDRVPAGGGSVGSRSIQVAGSAVLRAALEVRAAAVRLAAARLEAAEADVECRAGHVGVRGVPARALAWADLAAAVSPDGTAVSPDAAALTGADAVLDADARLDARCGFDQDDATYTFSAHLAVVEVDLDTGAVTPLAHHAVTDCGRVVDPPGATGQVVGACVQGIGQALLEELRHDGGTPTGASLAEYAMPSAAEVPAITAAFLATPSGRNPLGARGVGEVGMVGAPAAVHGAVVDALAHLGVGDVPMPCTPQRVWEAIRAAIGP
jgi:aerobic carbon-monoxide dehydrogenase large subunit